MCKPFFTIALLCSLTLAARAQFPHERAQFPHEEVRAVVDLLFDSMRVGDSTAVRAVLHPEARLISTHVQEDSPVLHVMSPDRFLAAIGMPRAEVWDERIWNVEIRVDDRLATAWMDYAFFVDDRFSHCGVNAFQFFRGEDGWEIIQITDTRRTDACDIPE